MCGDELNLVIVENDSASVKSSEVTVSQSVNEDLLNDKGDTSCEETVENVTQNRTDSNSKKSLNEEEAAILIQSAFRGFLVSSPSFNCIIFSYSCNIYIYLSLRFGETVNSIYCRNWRVVLCILAYGTWSDVCI